MTIRRLRLVAFLGFLLLVAASVAVTFAALQTQRDDALVINLAGRQRMLIQRMTLEVLGTQIGANRVYREDLHATAHAYFEVTLTALISGGQAPYADGATATLPPTRSPQILAQLEAVHANWEEMHAAIHAVLDSDPQGSAFTEGVAAVERLSPVMLAQMDEAVRLYEAEAARKVARVQSIQIGFLAAAALLLAAALVLTERWVLNPIDQLGSAARRIGDGDLDTPVSVAGPGEITRLTHSFDNMRQSLVASREKLERWAAELDARVAARTREVVHLSRVAQAANRHIEIGPLLDAMLPLLAEIGGASAAWVILLDERGSFYPAGAHNLPPALEADDRAQMRWPGCTCQRKLAAGELTAAANILECQRLQQARGDTRGLRYHASTPIRAGSRTLGILNLTTAGERVFDADELRLLTAVGDQLGAAIERALLHAQMKTRYIEGQAALLKLSQALLGETEAQAVMDLAVRVTAEALKVEFVAVALLDAEGASVSARASLGWPPEMLPRLQRVPPEAASALAQAIRSRAPVAIPDESRETRFKIPPWIAEMGIVSSLLAPMLAGGRAIGGLVVNSRSPRPWSDDEVRLLSLIANDTAQALERARQHAHAVERLGRITALHDIDVAISSSLSLQERLGILLEKVTERLGVDAAAVALIDVMTSELVYVARRGLNSDFFQDGLLRVKEGIAGQVAQTGAPMAVPDVRAEPRFVRRAVAERLGIVSYMAVPLRVRGEIIGVLELATRERRAFPQEEIDFFVTLAGQAAIALENARLFEALSAEKQRLELLYNLSQSLAASLEPREVAARALAMTTAALRVFRGEIFVREPGSERLRLVAMSGYDATSVEALDRELNLSVGQGLAGSAALARAPHIASDVAHDEHWLSVPGVDDWVRSAAAIPLLAGDELVGVLNLLSDREAFFHAEDLPLLTAVTVPMALALQNARLFEAEREQRELAEALRDAATALSATLDFDTVLDSLLGQIAPVVPYDTANVMLLDPPQAGGREARIRVARQRGYEQFGEQVVRDIAALSFDIATTANLRWMAETGKPLVIPDTAADPAWVKVEASARVRSWAGAPIVVEGQVIAFFSLDKIEPNFYRPEHGKRLAAFAGQAALALQNARLFEETGRRVQELALLYDAGLTLNRVMEPRMQLEFLLKLAATALRADAAEFFLFDPTRDELRYEFGIGLSAEEAEGLRRLRFAAADENTVPGWVATNRLLLNLPDAPADPRWVAVTDDPAFHSALFVPVAYEKQLRGILGVISKSGGAFTPQDERLLTLFANQVSVAMNNARLFEETRRRAEELEALSQVSATLRQAQTREAMLPLLVEKSMEALQADAGALILLQEGALVFAAARGPAESLRGWRHPLGDDPLWQVTRTGEPMFIPEVSEQSEFNRWEINRRLMAGMTACACVPLKTAEATVGLLHLAYRSRREATEGEIRLLTSIAEMAGNALHRAALHEQVARDAVELADAYEATLEGWARALELRDRETEGHTQRATDLTLQLARAMGLREEEIVHIRRGALLHDIGKMGVPDRILLKPGPLTDEEWAMMRQHPISAYEMLSAIEYLRPALDIPYCHHEKWDGTGYPRGLKGEEIPLAARLFAIVDVWDALRSDRPYRKAWPEERVREYIREQAGVHFDPRVVEVFLAISREQ